MQYVDRCPNGRSFLFRLFMISLAICFAGVIGGEALAKSDPKMAVKNRDKNGDGKVGRDEWKGKADIFTKIDTNGDNYLTVDEFTVHLNNLENAKSSKKSSTPVKKAAKKKDPKEKIPNKPLNSAIKSMDKNRDSKVARDEWTGPKSQFDNADVNHDDELTAEEIAITLIKEVDKNGNGLLDRAEWKHAKKDFNRIDQNGNTELTVEEYAADLGWTKVSGRR